MNSVSLHFKIEKATPEGRYVAGWLSVVEKDGKRVEDTQGDLISMDELTKGVHRYMRGSRVIKKQHSGGQIGEMVEVVMIDDAFAKAHGITHTKRGAWGTAEITDEATREDVKKGKVTGWSMGGRGKRTPIEKASKTFRGLRLSSAQRNALARMGMRGQLPASRAGGYRGGAETAHQKRMAIGLQGALQRKITRRGKRTPIEKTTKTFRGQRVSSAERRSMATRTLPKLRRHEGSWIATAPGGGAREFFTRGNAQRALDAGWKVKTAGAHLGSLSRRSKVRKSANFFDRFL